MACINKSPVSMYLELVKKHMTVKDKKVATEVGISTIKGLISAIPFVGGAINEFAFEARGRLKQERINSFIISLSEYIGQFKDDELNIEEIKKEEFGDFFEEVIIKVSKTRSEVKKEAFKILLANQLLRPKDIEYAEILLELINSLQERQIPILNNLIDSGDGLYIDYSGQLIQNKNILKDLENQIKDKCQYFDSIEDTYGDPEINDYESKIESTKKEIERLKEKVAEFETPFVAKTYDIPIYEFYYLIQDLCNKGLLIDNGMKYNAEPYTLFEISQLGIDLINTLK
ncbi:hypothetical protein [Flavobacterium yafengii]|uniref:hypothetical protein n=1 Tax=Flavobacterium yafengii TaxID=3041253 RepID=UPI0024A9D693|nr:hypothetical protein [Flavobacterium yafengii]MDI5897630.1 hypothetical protein [Flavobacterium yafengii]